jgi:hypothetical protein
VAGDHRGFGWIVEIAYPYRAHDGWHSGFGSRRFLKESAAEVAATELCGAYAGSFLIVPGEPPPLFYIDAVRFGETLLEGEVGLSAASPEVTIVYKTNRGTRARHN